MSHRKNDITLNDVLIGNVIGHGAFSTVYSCLTKETGALIAVKHMIVKDYATNYSPLGSPINNTPICSPLYKKPNSPQWSNGPSPDISVGSYFLGSPSDKNMLDNAYQIRREIKSLNRCKNNKNVIKIYNHIYTRDNCHNIYIFMEHASHGSLTDFIKKFKNKRLPISRLISFIKDIITGLDFIHKNKIIHRDLKSNNILIDKVGTSGLQCKISDFGCSYVYDLKKEMEDEDPRTFKGTLQWISPEIIMEHGIQDYKTDIWSFGCVILEMITSKLPFGIEGIGGVVKLHKDHYENDTYTNYHKEWLDYDDRYNTLLDDYLAKCIRSKPTDRANSEELLNHDLFTRSAKKMSKSLSLPNINTNRNNS